LKLFGKCGIFFVILLLPYYTLSYSDAITTEEEEEDDEGVQGHQKAITESKVKGQEDEVVEGQHKCLGISSHNCVTVTTES
jgi:hypothetical protein